MHFDDPREPFGRSWRFDGGVHVPDGLLRDDLVRWPRCVAGQARFERRGEVDYFDETGKNIKGFLLRTPVDGARMTSGFGMRRHPILGFNRMHQGIDFGADTGTPVLAAGEGVVVERRVWGGYGNWLKIRHANGWETGYGHLSAYAAGLYPGMKVTQGQIVGYVGATGLATGPHLHYEVWRGGLRVNPAGAAARQGVPLHGMDLTEFRLQRAQIDAMRKAAGPAGTTVAVEDGHEPGPTLRGGV